MLYLLAELGDLRFQLVVFGLLPLQESAGDVHLSHQSARRENVDIGEFVVAVLEITSLNPPFFNERFQTVIRLAEADTELVRQLPLRQIRANFKQLENPVTEFVRYQSVTMPICLSCGANATNESPGKAGWFQM